MSEHKEAHEAEEKPAAAPKNWKKIGIIGGGIAAGLILIIGVVVTVVMMMKPAEAPKKDASKEPEKTAEHQEAAPKAHAAEKAEASAPAHDAHASEEPPKHEEVASDAAAHTETAHEPAPVSAPAPHAAPSGLQSEILALQEEKRTLLQEQIELLKQQKAMMQQSGPTPRAPSAGGSLSGDKNCKLSGDPAKRTEELRLCLGLAGGAKTAAHAPHASGKKEAHGAAHEPGHWEYSGAAGPEYWGKLKPEFSACASGQAQSPINIVGSGQGAAPSLEFNYKPSDLRVINNGHTIQVNYSAGSSISVDGKPYDLVQFHFHTPSEELLNGRPFDMVIHLVHKNKAGQLAVVAVLLKQGQEQAGLAGIWPRLPANAGPEQVYADVKVDASKLLPNDKKRYFSFSGSLTTPPCTEGVRWFVMKNPITLSESQFKRFADIYSYNARPVQPIYKRVITEN